MIDWTSVIETIIGVLFPPILTILYLPIQKRIKLASFILICIVFTLLIAAKYRFLFSIILELIRQYLEYLVLTSALIISVYFIIYTRKYSKRSYEEIIIGNIQHVGISSRLFDKHSSATICMEQWKKGVCELLYDSLFLLKSGNHQELFKELSDIKQILEFTADSNYAYYIRTGLVTRNNLDKTFLKNRVRQISDITKLKWISPAVSPEIYGFLKSLIEEIDSQFHINESDLFSTSFSESVIPSLDREHLSIREIACLNFQIWEKASITSVKYESFFALIFYSLSLLGLFLIRNMWAFALYFLYLGIYLYGLSGKSKLRERLIGESLEFFNDTLDCRIKKRSKKHNFHNAKKLILASELLNSLDWLDEMTDEKKHLNLSILIYMITTFPKRRLKNFAPMETLELSIHFKSEKIPKLDSIFALELSFRYLRISLLNILKKLPSPLNL